MQSQHDALFNYTYASPESHDVVGWRADALVGNSAADMMHEADVDAMADAYQIALENRQPIVLTCRIIDEDGKPRWIQTMFRAVDAKDHLLIVAATRGVDAPMSRRATFKEVSEGDAAARPDQDRS